MEHTKFNSLLFMQRAEREREISRMEGFEDYVTESGMLKIIDDYGSTEIPYVRESYIKEVMNIVDNTIDKIKIKKILESVLIPTPLFKKSVSLIDTISHLGFDRLYSISHYLLAIEKTRYYTIANETTKNQYSQALASVDVIEDCITIVQLGVASKQKEYLKMALSTIADGMIAMSEHPMKYVLKLKYVALKTLINERDDIDAKEVFDKTNISNGNYHQIDLEKVVSLIKRSDGELARFLLSAKNKIESEIDIILADYNIMPYNQGKIQRVVESSSFKIVPTVIQHLKGGISKEALTNAYCKNEKLSVELSSVDLFRFSVAFPDYTTEQCITKEGEYVWMASNNLNVRLLMKDVNNEDLMYVKLVENCTMRAELDVVSGDVGHNPDTLVINRVKYREPSNTDLDSVTEGIKFTEDGGVKLTYKPFASYMDDYSRINKVLVLNHKNGNIEGMKTDLVYLFSFINELEKITKGKVRVNDSVKQDAVKARMFAIGDFKRYLAIVQEADPMFNFSKHFEDNYKSEDKVMIEFSNAEIKGFKKLLRTIMGY